MSHQTNEELQVLILIHSMNYLHYMLLWCARDISWRIPSDSLSFSGGTRLLGRDQTWVRWNVWHSQEPSSKANISLGKPLVNQLRVTSCDIHSHPRYSSGAEYQTQGNFQECTASLLEAQTMAYNWHNFEKTWNDICINQAELWNMQQLSLLLLGSLGPLPQQPSKFDAVVPWSLVFKASTNLWQNKS